VVNILPQFRIEPALLAPLAAAARALLENPPRQELLSGIHNPFGRGAALADCWKFLDVCESAAVLDVVETHIGPDIVLWDSELYLDAVAWNRAHEAEGRYWPADPVAGVVVDVMLDTGAANVFDVHAAPSSAEAGAHYVIRYMPATSRYNRDPRYAPNRIAMEERPLVNYLNRPIWLVRGEDRAGSDFSTGFAQMAPGWAGSGDRHTGVRRYPDGTAEKHLLDTGLRRNDEHRRTS
jgi:hypothetical protein